MFHDIIYIFRYIAYTAQVIQYCQQCLNVSICILYHRCLPSDDRHIAHQQAWRNCPFTQSQEQELLHALPTLLARTIEAEVRQLDPAPAAERGGPIRLSVHDRRRTDDVSTLITASDKLTLVTLQQIGSCYMN
ncbi:hypothetical protein DPMN_093939 [Dreissena polymorpha]|uniref:Uncharacterized protein n=1 Tax=Dreissena polymorpha TaxID=45954 RepID=A0A9D4L6H0_DREPO|nr:hypothetical protein DPMN_093939 [Dreissena polymorpha]